jgi:hypothetical protein
MAHGGVFFLIGWVAIKQDTPNMTDLINGDAMAEYPIFARGGCSFIVTGS